MVEKVCKRLPDETLQKKCDDFVQKYSEEILKFLHVELNPKFICTELGICSNQAQEDVGKGYCMYINWIALRTAKTRVLAVLSAIGLTD